MSSAQAQQSQAKQQITAKDNAEFDRLISGEKSTANPPSQNEHMVETLDKKPKRIEIIDDGAEDVALAKSATTASESENVSLKLDLSRVSEDESKGSTNTKSTSKDSINTKSTCPVIGSPSTSPRVPPVPTSSYQFQADWKVLKNTREQFYQYFKVSMILLNFI